MTKHLTALSDVLKTMKVKDVGPVVQSLPEL